PPLYPAPSKPQTVSFDTH
ncbi:hypothetical protein KIPB_016649, partial [Kipferlia bialata]